VVHPNYWGLLCLSVFCLAALNRNILVRTALQLSSIAIILAAESRSALVSILVAGFVLVLFRFQSARAGKDIKLAVLVALCLGIFIAFAVASQEIYDMFAKVFMVNDIRRGAGTGFTGRTALWRAGLDVFEAHPWFGVGARMESNFISVAGYSHAHNGYINMLVQYGAIGSGLFIALAILAFKRLSRLARNGVPGGSVGVAFLCGYAVGAIFDPKLINIGNSVSILMIMFLLRPMGRAFPPARKNTGIARQALPRFVAGSV
jgi:O-antigen ligase